MRSRIALLERWVGRDGHRRFYPCLNFHPSPTPHVPQRETREHAQGFDVVGILQAQAAAIAERRSNHRQLGGAPKLGGRGEKFVGGGEKLVEGAGSHDAAETPCRTECGNEGGGARAPAPGEKRGRGGHAGCLHAVHRMAHAKTEQAAERGGKVPKNARTKCGMCGSREATLFCKPCSMGKWFGLCGPGAALDRQCMAKHCQGVAPFGSE